MVERLLLDRVDAEAGRPAVGREDDLVVPAAAHEAQTALPFVQLAIAGAQVALDAPVFETVPVPARPALQDLLVHIAADLILRQLYIWPSRIDRATGEEDITRHESPAARGCGSIPCQTSRSASGGGRGAVGEYAGVPRGLTQGAHRAARGRRL